MSISITGLTWLWATLASAVLAYRLFIGWKKHGSTYLHRFAIFFALITAVFLLFGLTGFTSNPSSIKLLVFFGHILMWITFAVLAEIVWLLRLKNILSKWVLVAIVLIGGGIELYLEWTCQQLPEVVRLSSLFTVVQFQFCTSTFFAEVGLLWLITIPIGIIFILEAIKMEKELRKRPISIGIAFIVLSLAGVLTILRQPPTLLVIENIIISIGALMLLIGAISVSPSKEPKAPTTPDETQ